MVNDIKNEANENSIIFFKKISLLDKFNFFEYLSVMLNSWVWMWESLESVLDKVNNIYFKQRINQLFLFVTSGDSLSKAMKKDPHVFSSNEISIVEAWEATWTLDSSLLSLSENLKKTYDLKRKVKGALTYPLIIFIFLFLAIIIVLTYVIPSIMPLFENLESELPIATKALIWTSDFVKNNFLLIVFFFFSIFVFLVWYKSTEVWKEKLDNMLLNMPLVWNVYKNYILSNISWSIWNLIWAWVPTLKVLKLVGKASGSIVYERIFGLVTKKVESWEKIVDSMKQVDEEGFYFPSTFLQMLSVWEKTANIKEISKKMYDQYNREVEYSLASLTKWIEPLAILLAAVFVIWFVFAIFGAIMKITTMVW